MLLLGSSGTGSHGDIAKAVDFDGTNDYLLRASDLTGNADGKTFTFSAWVWFDGNPGTGNYLYDSHSSFTGGVTVTLNGNVFRFIGYAPVSNTPVVHAAISTDLWVHDTWVHILISCDMANVANRFIYVNDVDQAAATWPAYTDANINFSTGVHEIARDRATGSAILKARLSNVFLDYTYRDLSIEANRRLFITADRKPAQGQAALNPILYLPMDDPTTAHINQGTGGNFALTGVIARSGRGPNQYNAVYSDLDGAADGLYRSSVTGLTDGKTLTLRASFVFDAMAVNHSILCLGNIAAGYFTLMAASATTLIISGINSSGFQVLDGRIAGMVSGRNYTLVVSIDLSSVGNRHVYLDGVAVSVTWNTYINDDIDFTGGENYVGISANGSVYFNGRVGGVWFNRSYLDLSVSANLTKFVTGTGIDAKPVDLGANGELPTGTAPLIYLPMYGNTAGKNYGTGGDFTEFSGPYTGARGPNEFWGNKAAATSGSYVGRAATPALTGVANAKIVSMSFFAAHSVGVRNDVVQCNTSTVLPLIVGTNGTDKVWLQAWNSAGTQILDAVAASGEGDTAMHHYCLSFDLSNASLRSVYVDGAAKSMAWNIYTNDSIPFASLINFYIGAMTSSSATLAELYLTSTYIDFSQEANRLLFRDAFGNPTDLPAAIAKGAVPNPAVYMRFDPANQGLNSGTGGNFTKSGTITDGGQL